MTTSSLRLPHMALMALVGAIVLALGAAGATTAQAHNGKHHAGKHHAGKHAGVHHGKHHGVHKTFKVHKKKIIRQARKHAPEALTEFRAASAAARAERKESVMDAREAFRAARAELRAERNAALADADTRKEKRKIRRDHRRALFAEVIIRGKAVHRAHHVQHRAQWKALKELRSAVKEAKRGDVPAPVPST